MSVLIRPATLSDLPELTAWNAAMAWETEHKRLHPPTLERGIAAVFEQPGAASIWSPRMMARRSAACW